jgi:hypothetical protein
MDFADAWRGTLSVHQALVLVEQLKNVPNSRYRAAWRGGPQFQNWETEHAVLADTYDMLQQMIAGLVGVTVPSKAYYPRPVAEIIQARTVAEFDVGNFLRIIQS